MYEYKATVVSIYDGDTVKMDVDLGFYTHLSRRSFRLAGIDAPELIKGLTEGIEARDYLRSLIPIGSIVTIKTIKDRQEKYGRWLAYIINDADVNVNNEMLRSNHAVPFMESSL